MANNKDNMKQAMKELLGKVGVGPEGEEPEAMEADGPQKDWEDSGERRFSGGFIHKQEDGAMSEGAMETSTVSTGFYPSSSGDTVISVGTSIFGDIRAEGNVEVNGKLKGNLEASGNVRVSGKVLGNVKGAAVELCGCTIQGNIISASSLRIDSESMVVGDINAVDLMTDGKVKGNMQIENSASFQRNAVLAGNVTATRVMMCEGTKVQGTVRITEDGETSALFGEKLDI